jgi:hypothetical protein
MVLMFGTLASFFVASKVELGGKKSGSWSVEAGVQGAQAHDQVRCGHQGVHPFLGVEA